MDRLISSYKRGYIKALIDLSNWMEMHSVVIGFHRYSNAKVLQALIKCLLKDNEALDEFIATGGEYPSFVASKDKKKVEVWRL